MLASYSLCSAGMDMIEVSRLLTREAFRDGWGRPFGIDRMELCAGLAGAAALVCVALIAFRRQLVSLAGLAEPATDRAGLRAVQVALAGLGVYLVFTGAVAIAQLLAMWCFWSWPPAIPHPMESLDSWVDLLLRLNLGLALMIGAARQWWWLMIWFGVAPAR